MTAIAHSAGGVGLSRDEVDALQSDRLHTLLGVVLESNEFYRRKLKAAGFSLADGRGALEQHSRLPFTTKQELSSDQAEQPPYGTNLSLPADEFARVHQTSGTTGTRLRWLDTKQTWEWFADCWQAVYGGAGVTSRDRIFFAFSFGPFIGFWSAFEAARQMEALAIPGGGMSSEQRVRAIIANEATVLLCTPTYGLHLAEVATGLGVNLAQESAVRVTIQAGEPGAGLPATRKRIEAAWGARCFDHAGATEVGPWGFECDQADGLHINEAEFIYEVVDPQTLEPSQEGELVITNLGRAAMPVIRYRTGDRVRLRPAGEVCACGSPFAKLDGGVIGRVDDALLIRGLVVYPSHIENVLRRFPEVGEFAVDVHRPQAMDELEIRLEELEKGAAGARGGAVDGALADRVARAIREEFGLRASVTQVERGTLPRFELKARRFTDHRKAEVGEVQ